MNQALRYFGWPLLAGLLLALLLIQRYPHWVGLDQPGAHGQALLGARSQAATYSYANAVDKASPAVANLYTSKLVSRAMHPLMEDPQFRQFFGDNLPRQQRMESSLGSAVLISHEGYLLTNNHVIGDANEITVIFNDGLRLKAEVIGTAKVKVGVEAALRLGWTGVMVLAFVCQALALVAMLAKRRRQSE